MAKLSKFDMAKSAAAPALRVMASWFAKNPKTLAGVATALKMKGKSLTPGKVLTYVRENPLSSYLILDELTEFAPMMGDIFEASPDLKMLVDAQLATDTVESLVAPKLRTDVDVSTASSLAKIGELTLAQADEFKDEFQLIDRVLARLGGSTEDVRMLQLLELRKVIEMPVANFTLYNWIKTQG